MTVPTYPCSVGIFTNPGATLITGKVDFCASHESWHWKRGESWHDTFYLMFETPGASRSQPEVHDFLAVAAGGGTEVTEVPTPSTEQTLWEIRADSSTGEVRGYLLRGNDDSLSWYVPTGQHTASGPLRLRADGGDQFCFSKSEAGAESGDFLSWCQSRVANLAGGPGLGLGRMELSGSTHGIWAECDSGGEVSGPLGKVDITPTRETWHWLDWFGGDPATQPAFPAKFYFQGDVAGPSWHNPGVFDFRGGDLEQLSDPTLNSDRVWKIIHRSGNGAGAAVDIGYLGQKDIHLDWFVKPGAVNPSNRIALAEGDVLEFVEVTSASVSLDSVMCFRHDPRNPNILD